MSTVNVIVLLFIENSGIGKSVWLHSVETLNEVHVIVVEIFQSGPMKWTNKLTDRLT